MVFGFYRCDLCDSKGRLEIGDNFNKFSKVKNLSCPVCGGRGKLAIKPIYDPNNKRWKKKK